MVKRSVRSVAESKITMRKNSGIKANFGITISFYAHCSLFPKLLQRYFKIFYFIFEYLYLQYLDFLINILFLQFHSSLQL